MLLSSTLCRKIILLIYVNDVIYNEHLKENHKKLLNNIIHRQLSVNLNCTAEIRIKKNELVKTAGILKDNSKMRENNILQCKRSNAHSASLTNLCRQLLLWQLKTLL